MKVRPECLPCNLERLRMELGLAGVPEERGLAALGEFSRVLSEVVASTVPADLGTLRLELLARHSGGMDPYGALKEESDRVARGLVAVAEEFYRESGGSLEALLRVGAAANSMEFGVRGHRFRLEEFRGEFRRLLGSPLRGEAARVSGLLGRYSRVLYLLDNCGEQVLDLWIAGRLRGMGKEVLLSPKSAPVMNDATLEDLRRIGYAGPALPSGPVVGTSLGRAGEEFRRVLMEPGVLVWAKGMGHYETLSEVEGRLRGRLVYLFRAKCEPVARSVGVEKGDLVVRVV